MKTILSVGTTPVYQRSMTFDRVTIDDVNRSGEVHDYASGKSINVARAAHTLGEDVLTTGFVGGSRGAQLCLDLDVAGIQHDFVLVSPQTRQCITVIDRSTGTATELVEESSAVGASAWAALDRKLEDLLPRAKVWILSGTLPPGAPVDFYCRWVRSAREAGALVVLDARGEPMKVALQHSGFVLKINRDELAATVGRDLSNESQVLEAMRRSCPANGRIVITLGAAGAMASDGQSAWRVRSPKVRAISAVGSGDAFAAGLAIGLSRGEALPQACQLAAACGAANALTPLAGHLRAEDVERLRAEVHIEQIS